MLFAAGLGKRLGHKTRNHPKALVKVGDKTLLEHNLLKLKDEGFTSVIINVHHFASQIIEFLKVNNNFGLDIQISFEMEQLLETGGGIQKASWFFEDSNAFVAHNVDILSAVSLNDLLRAQMQSDAMATLAVSKRNSSRYLLFDDEGLLCGWENTITGEHIQTRQREHLQRFAFSGIQAINPKIFNEITEQGAFSIIDVYLRLAANFPIRAFEHASEAWFDVGTPEKLKRAEQYYQ